MPRNEGFEIEVQAQPRDRGVGRDVAAEVADLPYVRLTQRVQPPRDRRNLWLLLALVLLAHALLAWLAYLILRPAPEQRHPGDVISITLIEPSPTLPPPPAMPAPPPLPGQPAPPPRHLHYVPPAQGAIQATMQGVKGPPLDLYQSNGQIRLPTGGAPQAAPAYSVPEIKGSRIYGGQSPVPYKPTRFAKDFAPTNQSLGTKAINKVIEKTTVEKTIHLPLGVKVRCAANPLLMFAGGLLACGGMPPPPPPKNDNDIRLSMPPAATLTGKKVVVPKAASSAAAPASSGPD